MSKLNTNSAIPLYQQLYDVILKKITSGEYTPGDKIPSEPQLREEYAISRITVRSTLQQLEDEGLVIRKPGKGTFVTSQLQTNTIFLGSSFTGTCEEMNRKPSTNILVQAKIISSKKVSDKLHLTDNSEVIEIHRLRLMDNVPCILEYDYFPISNSFLLDLNLENTSLFKVIKKHLPHTMIDASEDYFNIQYASKKISSLLDCSVNYPLLQVSQTILDQDGNPIYYNEQLIHSERYTYAVYSTTHSSVEVCEK